MEHQYCCWQEAANPLVSAALYSSIQLCYSKHEPKAHSGCLSHTCASTALHGFPSSSGLLVKHSKDHTRATLRSILTCDMLLTSLPSSIFVLSRWWSSIVGCSHQFSEMLIVSTHGVPKVPRIQLMLFGCSLLLKPSRSGKLSSHHFKSPTYLFALKYNKYNNCKQHSSLCVL